VGQLAAQHLGLALSGARLAVQGLGNVGGVAARLFAQAGARVVVVQDHTGTVYREAGLDLEALLAHSARHAGVAGFEPAQALSHEAFWEVRSDILIPAALEQQITAERALRLQTRLILEGANGPTTPAADDILADRNILVVPDVIANAGGVTVSYFEWVQDFSSFFWDEAEINRRLVRVMRPSRPSGRWPASAGSVCARRHSSWPAEGSCTRASCAGSTPERRGQPSSL
jgi:glutamate dehydrogenase (NAD(P)+)